MKRRNFIAAVSSLAAASCAPRMDKREKRYDEKECPFCSVDPGKCFYCTGHSGKCSFCNGAGTRKTSTKNYPNNGIEQVEYEEKCQYCKGTGTCRYCDGTGKCWACKGTGKIESWEFYEKYHQQKSSQ